MSEHIGCLESEEIGGEKLQVVKAALHTAMSRVLAGWNVSLLAACFPSLAVDNKDFIETIRVNIVEVVEKALLEDFDEMIDEDIVKSLEEFSTAVKDSCVSKGTVAWRPTGDPKLDMMAHDARVLYYEKQHILESLKHAKLVTSKAEEAIKQGYKKCHENQKEIQKNLSVVNELLETSQAINEGHNSGLCKTVFLRPSN
ncbi:uncharacterized protein LOC123518962 [Portunus trituberculatus]|uniref:uncharacterized protein LOC123518962 n=1 Tax=Portunus trituberculatus TaxID=210409 RepID=UPI001E1D1755|nr:uncharacterized protein LOC123518962 [Portunus trituberculatus]XP_045135977.1 uncharacterized protein LOC123518962 [Portunus trituberculatus]XP_045135978.1 uncharacterized protein LOC123518962 [Portunus trituberculatus]